MVALNKILTNLFYHLNLTFMNKLLLFFATIFLIYSCNGTEKKESDQQAVSSQHIDSSSVAAADTSWSNIWKTESSEIKVKLDALGQQLQKSSKKVAMKANEDLVKELETQRESFDTSHTKVEIQHNWEDFKVKANRIIDSLNAKLSIE